MPCFEAASSWVMVMSDSLLFDLYRRAADHSTSLKKHEHCVLKRNTGEAIYLKLGNNKYLSGCSHFGIKIASAQRRSPSISSSTASLSGNEPGQNLRPHALTGPAMRTSQPRSKGCFPSLRPFCFMFCVLSGLRQSLATT